MTAATTRSISREYYEALSEAAAEFDEWDQRISEIYLLSTHTKFVKQFPRKPRCECGELHFSKGKCKTCYFREYNKNRKESRSGWKRPETRRKQQKRWRAANPDKVKAQNERYKAKKVKQSKGDR